MNEKKIISEYVVAALLADATVKRLTGGSVFAFMSKKPVPGAFVALGGYNLTYEQTRDGIYPDTFSFSLSCVAESLTVVDELEASCAAIINGAVVPGLGCSCRLTQSATKADGSDYVTELTFVTDL